MFFCAEYGIHVSLPIYSGGLGVLADQGANLLDQVEQRPALLAGEGLAQQGADAPDVGAQRRVGAVGV